MFWDSTKNLNNEELSLGRKKPLGRQHHEAVGKPIGPTTAGNQMSLVSDSMTEDTKRLVHTVVFLVVAGLIFKAIKDSKDKTGIPKFGEYLLYLFLTKKERENLIGDLAEGFSEVKLKFGRVAAHIYYYKQVFTSIWPLSRKAFRWGLIAWLGNWIRRLI